MRLQSLCLEISEKRADIGCEGNLHLSSFPSFGFQNPHDERASGELEDGHKELRTKRSFTHRKCLMSQLDRPSHLYFESRHDGL